MDDPLYVIGCGLWRIIIVHLSVGNKHRTKERSLALHPLLFNDHFTIFLTLQNTKSTIWTHVIPVSLLFKFLITFFNVTIRNKMAQKKFEMERECFN